MNASRQIGEIVETEEVGREQRDHPTINRVFHELRTGLQQATVGKKMSQAQLATANSEKRAVSTAYKSGKGILNCVITSKTLKNVGCEVAQGQVKCSNRHCLGGAG